MIQHVSRWLSTFALLLLLSACGNSPPAMDGVTHIDNDELAALLDEGTLLIDIRRREEWRETGIIEGSKMITLFNVLGSVEKDFVSRLQRIAKTDQAVAIICRTGNRTLAASEMLTKQLGYTNIYNVTNGITNWIKEDRAIVGGQVN